ncbi:sensor histidine kinase [Leifsonia sp. Root112D2]|uniref:sensor histidine kinase n=2 Tax=Bacteria TaxID=2 RepID=UPI0006F3BF63|nr:histidine kinase [Leifsonia sp. Root112D2]KQV07784.1 hypothetical protein ASC63_11350 [Leifsonia sp. Root112D2]
MAQSAISLGRTASAAEGDLRLPRPPGVIRRFWARHPWVTDSLITAFYAIPVLVGTIVLAARPSSDAGAAVLDVLGIVFATVSVAAVLLRRRIPLTALGVSIFCATIAFPWQGSLLAFGICFLLYAVAVYRSNRAAWIGLACAVAALSIGSLLPLPRPTDFGIGSAPVATWAVLMLLAVLIGVNIGNRKRYLEALLDRAAQLARERDQQAQLATAAERARIAREMHDIVSHSLTVMVTLADGSAALTGTAPERSEAAMRQVAETGRQALTEMRRMLGVLTEQESASGDALAPQPGTDSLAALIETFRTAGLPVRSSVTGIAPNDPGRQLTVFRTVQESLTNALRYAPDATTVAVDIRYAARTVAITVSDNGSGTFVPGQGAARGLVGIAERVALYGGTVTSGPRDGGGWRVRAEFDAGEGNDA